MTIQNEILQAKPLGPRITAVEPLDNYQLLLTWTNGEKRIFDGNKLLLHKVFEPLKNKVLFRKIKIFNGTITWGNDLDYCADTLYLESVPVQ